MAERPSLSKLNAKLASTRFRYPSGSLWRHQKSKCVYEIVTISARESDGIVEVVFRPAPNPNMGRMVKTISGRAYDGDSGDEVFEYVVHHRPLDEWEELVDIDGDLDAYQPRFIRVETRTIFTDARR